MQGSVEISSSCLDICCWRWCWQFKKNEWHLEKFTVRHSRLVLDVCDRTAHICSASCPGYWMRCTSDGMTNCTSNIVNRYLLGGTTNSMDPTLFALFGFYSVRDPMNSPNRWSSVYVPFFLYLLLFDADLKETNWWENVHIDTENFNNLFYFDQNLAKWNAYTHTLRTTSL